MDIQAFLAQAKAASPKELDALMQQEKERILALDNQESSAELKGILSHLKGVEIPQRERTLAVL